MEEKKKRNFKIDLIFNLLTKYISIRRNNGLKHCNGELRRALSQNSAEGFVIVSLTEALRLAASETGKLCIHLQAQLGW